MAATLATLTVAAFAARTLPARSVVLGPDGVRLLGADAFYHLRHAEHASRHFPSVQRPDPDTRYPTGDGGRSAGLYAVGIAAAARLAAGGTPERETLARAAAWKPPVLGALAVPALFALARPWLGTVGALLACALFVALPGPALPRTLLGFSDHHAAEIPLALLSLAGIAWLRVGRRTGGTGRAALAAAPLVIFAFTWLGAALWIGIACAAACGLVLGVRAGGGDARRAATGARRYGLAVMAGIALVAVLRPEQVMSVPLLGAGLCLATLLAVAPRPLAVAPSARLAAGGLGLAAVGLLAWTVAPADARALAGGLLAARPVEVAEHAPLTLPGLWRWHGTAFPLAAAGAVLSVVALLRRREPHVAIVPLIAGALLLGLVAFTHDLAYALSPFVALLAARALIELRRLRMPLRGVVASCAALLLVAPVWPAKAVRGPVPSSTDVESSLLVDAGWHEALAWLAAQPRTGGEGVLAAWGFGHAVAALAGRPPVFSHGLSTREARWWLTQSEAESLALLCPACRGDQAVGFVVVDARSLAQDFRARVHAADRDPAEYRGVAGTARHEGTLMPLPTYGEAYARSVAARLYLRDGRDLDGYRLVYRSHAESFVAYHASFEHRPEGVEVRTLRRAFPIRDAAERVRFEALMRQGVAAFEGGLLYRGRILPSVKVFAVTGNAS